MQAIVTKYLPATNTKGSRIKATCDAGSVTIPYPHELSGEDCHKAAAQALVIKLGWNTPFYGELIGGGLPNNAGYVFVMHRNAAKDALGNLLQWAFGNRGNKSGNPFSVPEVVQGLRELHYINTGDASDDVPYDAADAYKTKG